MTDMKKEEVKQIADAARIAITDEEVAMFNKHLKSMTDHATQLQEVNTDGVEPTTYVLDLQNVMRQDKPKQWTTQEEVLKNAPDQKDGHFRVPSILD